MSTLSAEDQVAILLNLLGSELAEPLIAELSPAQVDNVRRRLETLEQSPPSQGDIDDVLEEFERFFRFAMSTGEARLRIAPGTAPSAFEKYPLKPRPKEHTSEKEQFEFSDDPIADLNRLEPFQIAGALQGEHPRTIALVLNRLEAEEAAKTLTQLPEEIRGPVFLLLKEEPEGSGELVNLVVRTTVEKGATFDRDTLEEPDNDHKMANLLRSMEKSTRTQMLEVLDEDDADAAGRVKDLLYIFDDLLKVDNRSLQKLLGEIDSQTLATALKGADEPLIEKLLGNLSKRARKTLSEEMEFMSNIDAETIAIAQKTIVDAMAQLDESGELLMES